MTCAWKGCEAATAAARYRELLLAFVKAYANVERFDQDTVQVELFKTWLAAAAALDLPPSPARPPLS